MEENIKNPTVSVILPVYNGESYIKQSIGSILGQTHSNLELIIIDDGSTDSSAKIIKTYKDERIRYYYQENKGVSASRNRGIKLATGEFIAMHDADDLSDSLRLAKQVEFFNKNPNVGLLGSNYKVIDAKGGVTTITDVFTNHDDLKLAEVCSNQFGQGATMLRRKYLENDGYEENRKLAEDYDLWTRISCQTQIANLREPLYSWRNVGTGASTKPENLEELDREQMVIRMREFKRLRENRSEYKLFSLHPLSTLGGPKKYLQMKNTLFRDMALLYCYSGLRRYAILSLFLAVFWAPWIKKTYAQMLTVIFNKNMINRIPYEYI